MRIVVASAPKSGNHWIKCLLAEIYGLEVIEGEDKDRLTAKTIPEQLVANRFPDRSIMHIHNRCGRRLCNAIDDIPARIVTIIRDPYDAFLSLYHWQQQRDERALDRRQGRPRQVMATRVLDDPEVLDFIRSGYGKMLEQANGWLHGGRSVVIRYESLHENPRDALEELTTRIEPASREAIDAAIDNCGADIMRERSEKMRWHIRSATVGASRSQLGPEHLAAFRECHADAIQSLGYPVR
jgi:hypothetical protein